MITYDEREKIISAIKDNIEGNKTFLALTFARALDCEFDNDKKCWEKLLELIESAPAAPIAPTPHNMKAIELADKLDMNFSDGYSFLHAISSALGYDPASTTARQDCKNLIEAIRNLDAPEDTIKWPLDKDGVKIEPGDTVYFREDECAVHYIALSEVGTFIGLVGSDRWYSPDLLSHKKSRTLNEITSEIMHLLEYSGCDDLEDEVNARVHEAYEMGRSDKDE